MKISKLVLFAAFFAARSLVQAQNITLESPNAGVWYYSGSGEVVLISASYTGSTSGYDTVTGVEYIDGVPVAAGTFFHEGPPLPSDWGNYPAGPWVMDGNPLTGGNYYALGSGFDWHPGVSETPGGALLGNQINSIFSPVGGSPPATFDSSSFASVLTTGAVAVGVSAALLAGIAAGILVWKKVRLYYGKSG